MDFNNLMSNPLVVSIVSLFLGAIITYFFQKYQNRMIRIFYKISQFRVGMTIDDPIFGSISVSFNQAKIKNLFHNKITLENVSNKDIEDIKIIIYVGNGTNLLTDNAYVLDTTRLIYWSNEYKKSLDSMGEKRWDIYFNRREYNIETFNRFEKAEISFLCSRDIDENFPDIYVETKTKGIKMKHNPDITTQTHILGVETKSAAIIGVLFSFILFAGINFCIDNRWVASFIILVAGIFASIFGAIIYKLKNFLRSFIN